MSYQPSTAGPDFDTRRNTYAPRHAGYTMMDWFPEPQPLSSLARSTLSLSSYNSRMVSNVEAHASNVTRYSSLNSICHDTNGSFGKILESKVSHVNTGVVGAGVGLSVGGVVGSLVGNRVGSSVGNLVGCGVVVVDGVGVGAAVVGYTVVVG